MFRQSAPFQNTPETLVVVKDLQSRVDTDEYHPGRTLVERRLELAQSMVDFLQPRVSDRDVVVRNVFPRSECGELIQSRLRLGVWKQRLLEDPTRIMEAYLGVTQGATWNAT